MLRGWLYASQLRLRTEYVSPHTPTVIAMVSSPEGLVAAVCPALSAVRRVLGLRPKELRPVEAQGRRPWWMSLTTSKGGGMVVESDQGREEMVVMD